MGERAKDISIKDFFYGEDSTLIDLSVSVVCVDNWMKFYWAKAREVDQTFAANPNVTLDFFVKGVRSYYKKHPEAHYYVTMNSEVNMVNANAIYDALIELGADVMIKEEFWFR